LKACRGDEIGIRQSSGYDAYYTTDDLPQEELGCSEQTTLFDSKFREASLLMLTAPRTTGWLN